MTYKSGSMESDIEMTNDSGDRSSEVPSVKHKFYDHICRNTSEQSTFASMSMLELVGRHSCLENRSIKRVALRTDNAANYHNRVLPVVAPYIMKRYDIELISIVHNKTQDGKGHADLHFAVVTRYVDKYIEVLKLDVVTPMDLVNAINNGRGLKGTIAELFDVNMDHGDMKRWKDEQRKKAKDSSFQVLGRCNIIQYSQSETITGAFVARCRANRYSEEITWHFQRYSSQLIAGHVVAEDVEDEDDEIGHNTNIHGELDRNVRGACSTGEATDRGIDRRGDTTTGGMRTGLQLTATESCGNTDERGCIENTSIYQLHTSKVLFEGPETGVKMVTSGVIQREATESISLARRLFTQGRGEKSADERSEAVHERTEHHADRTDAISDDALGVVDLASDDSGRDMSEEERDEETSHKFRFNGSYYYCRQCGQSYIEKSNVLRHWSICGVRENSCHVVDRACLDVNRLIEMNQLVVARHPETNPHLLKIAVIPKVRRSIEFAPCWGERPAKGGTLGKSFVDPFKPQLKAMVERGERDKGKKLSCGKMQEQLQLSNPSRYDIPNVHSINWYVKSVLRKIRKAEEKAKRVQQGLPLTYIKQV